MVGGFITGVMSNIQARLNERVLRLVRSYYPHLESMLFMGSAFKSAGLFRQLEWSQSFTLEEDIINPWKSSLMEVDEGFTINEGESSSSSKTTIMVNNAKVMIK